MASISKTTNPLIKTNLPPSAEDKPLLGDAPKVIGAASGKETASLKGRAVKDSASLSIIPYQDIVTIATQQFSETFFTAMLINDIPTVKALLKNGFNVNTLDKYGQSPLMKAIIWGDRNLVNILLENKADVNLENEFGTTALILASEKGHVDIVNILLDHGATINHKTKYDTTPLMQATLYNQATTVKTLVDNGAIAKEADGGFSVLINAGIRDFVDIIIILLSKIDLKTIEKYYIEKKGIAT